MAFENMYEPLPEGLYIDMVDIYADWITEAIEDVVIVQFDYKGYYRVVEPYELGQTILGDNLLRGYQIAGESFGRRIAGWKLFRLDYISFLEVSAEEFPIRGEYQNLPPFWTYVPIIVLPGGPKEVPRLPEIPSKRKLVVNPITGVEHMVFEVDCGGIPFYFDDFNSAAAAAKKAILASLKLPGRLHEYIDGAQLVDEISPTGSDVIAKIQDGFITIFGGRTIDLGVIAHEAAHSYADEKYEWVAPPETSDYMAAVNSGEPPVSAYAFTSPGEDFAEAVRVYAEDPAELKDIAPRRFGVIDRLMKDPAYGG